MNLLNVTMSNTNPHRVRNRIAIGMLLFAIYYVMFHMFYNQLLYKTIYPYRDIEDLFVSTLTNIVPMTVIMGINLMVIYRLTHIKNTILKALADCVISFGVTVAVNALFLIATSGTRHNEVDWAGTMFNNMLIFIGLEAMFYVDNFQRQLRDNERLRSMAMQYELNAIKTQIDPHFLFNSLNLLYSIVTVDPQKSKEFIIALSNIYRYILSNSGRNLVSLRDELAFLHEYSAVLAMRYYNQLTLRIVYEDGREFDDNLSDQIKIIPFTMQLLLENVTKHNIISSRHTMEVTVTIGSHSAEMSNPIVPRQCKTTTGIGLSYLTRLYAAQKKQFGVNIHNYTFKAHIPYITI